MADIDFVILWVDGEDPQWREELVKTRGSKAEDASLIRYRDWRNLEYWFRAVEQFAPWVRRIHFVTWGHLPKWLNTSHAKLNIVNHSDFILAQYLPTFSSNPIEFNVHRIAGLAEQFVLFNDDMFLLRPTSPSDFFKNGYPCDVARLSVVQPSSIGHLIYNCLELINKQHKKNQCVWRNPGKWFSPKYGITTLAKSATLMPWSFFCGLWDSHMPQPYRKDSFSRAWRLWGSQIDATCRNRIRSITDLIHWLVRYDVLARGEFVPVSLADTRLMTLSDATITQICDDIERQRYRMVCLNDGEQIGDFDQMSESLRMSFDKILPKKSSYEL